MIFLFFQLKKIWLEIDSGNFFSYKINHCKLNHLNILNKECLITLQVITYHYSSFAIKDFYYVIFWGTIISIHYYYVSFEVNITYKFFLTWRWRFCPTNVHTKAFVGIDLMNCKCLAPLFLQRNLSAGKGIFMRDPFKIGEQDTTFISNASAVSNRDPNFWFF